MRQRPSIPELSGRHARTLLEDAIQRIVGAFCPNGEWVAYQSDETGEFEIYVRRFPGAGDKRQVSTNGGTYPVWRRDGRELFYRNGDQIVAVAVSTDGGSSFWVGRRCCSSAS